MIVLVNRNSASASEIVSGALQDHDRALIVGETTFGKALVQSIYRVSQGAGLALTTARYYTPSGRLIQRPWDGTFDEYLTYTLRDQDAERPHDREGSEVHGQRAARCTAAAASSRIAASTGRSKASTRRASPARSMRAAAVRQLTRSGSRPRATRASRRDGKDRKYRRRPTSPSTTRWSTDFKAFVDVAGREDGRGRRSTADLAFIKAMIRYEIDLALFGVADGAAAPDRGRSAGADRPRPVPRGRAAHAAGPDEGGPQEPAKGRRQLQSGVRATGSTHLLRFWGLSGSLACHTR